MKKLPNPKMLQRFSFILLLCLFLASCEQLEQILPKPQPTPQPTAQELLLAGTASKTWIQVDFRYNGSGGNWDRLRPCERDDLSVFYASKQYEKNQGELACFSQNPFIIEKGGWKITGNKLRIEGTTFPNGEAHPDYTITELTATRLVLAYPMEGTGGTITLSRIFQAK